LPFFVKIGYMMSESARANKAEEFNQRVEVEFGKIQAGWEKSPETGEAIKSNRYFRVFPEELAGRLNESVFCKILQEKIEPALGPEEARQIRKELADLGSNLFGQYFLFDREATNLQENPFLVSNAGNKIYRSQKEICSNSGSFEVEAESFLNSFLRFAKEQNALSAEVVEFLQKGSAEIMRGKKVRLVFDDLPSEEIARAINDIRTNVWSYLGNSDWQATDKDEYGEGDRIVRKGYLTRGADELIMQVRRPALPGVDPAWVRDAAHPNRMTGVNVITLSGKYSKLAKIEVI